MKKIMNTIAILFIAISCKAQSPIINIKDDDGNHIQDAYYKDIDNLLNPFIGTYTYTNGNTSLKIILKKIVMHYDDYLFEDILVGEYQYIENGVTKIDRLNELNLYYSDEARHGIDGNMILNNGYLCATCNANHIGLMLGLVEASTHNWAQLVVEPTTVGGQPAIKLNVWWQMKAHIEGTPLGANPSFPGGNYVLIKQ